VVWLLSNVADNEQLGAFCLNQVRSLQRMASSVFVRGMSSSLCGSSRGMTSRHSSSGGFMVVGAHSYSGRAASRLAAHPIGDISEGGTATDGLFSGDEHDTMGGDLSPMTPARPSGMCGGDILGDPLMVRNCAVLCINVEAWTNKRVCFMCQSPAQCSAGSCESVTS
jgi:hypothetical protein